MKKRPRYRVRAILSFLMALWVLNFSIDSPDAPIGRSQAILSMGQEDLSINDIESIAELIVENFLGHTDAIPEHDEADDQSDIQKIADYAYTMPVFSIRKEFGIEVPIAWTIHLEPGYIGYLPDITPPPPKQLGSFILFQQAV